MIAIIGGGLAGLSLSYFLENSKIKAEIFEAEKRLGGLMKSEVIDGFTFDSGGSHIIFSNNGEILREMIEITGNVVMHLRRTYIYYDGKYVKYPFENGIYMLPESERFKILRDFVENLIKKERKPPENLLEWFYAVFGKEITERYLKPYNEKLWGRDLTDISLEWVKNRIPNPPIVDILKSCVGIPTEGYKHQLRFYYPLKGGIETLIRRLNDNINAKINLSQKVKRIEIDEDRVIIKTKKVEKEYEFVISTAPLHEIALAFDDSKEIRREANKLEVNSLTVVGLGIKGEIPDFHWIYVPNKEIIFHRLAFLSNYSPFMSPEGYASVIAEISHKADEKIRDPIEKVIDGLYEMGFDFDVVVDKSWEWKYAYVVYDHKCSKAVKKLKDFLIERKVIPHGRFGGWDYLNMDGVWEKSKKLAEVIKKIQDANEKIARKGGSKG